MILTPQSNQVSDVTLKHNVLAYTILRFFFEVIGFTFPILRIEKVSSEHLKIFLSQSPHQYPV